MEHSKDFPDSFFRVTVKGLCVRGGKILLLKETPDISGKWEMPGGGLDFGESIPAGLEREIREETGLKVSEMSKAPIYAWTYKYEGKRGMDWYYTLVLAYRIELESLDFTPSDECEAIGFFSKDELKTNELNGQTNELLKIFDPEDFKESF
jgi:8-oxo-dGTP diphosphatase